jgi:hypothetical protein
MDFKNELERAVGALVLANLELQVALAKSAKDAEALRAQISADKPPEAAPKSGGGPVGGTKPR